MKRIVTLAAIAAALVGTASSAEAQRWRHRDRVTVIERTGPDVSVVLGGLLLGQVLNEMSRQRTFQEPIQQPVQPKLDPFRPAPPLK